MEFLSHDSEAKDNKPVVLVGVYTDKITVSSVKYENGEPIVITAVKEQQEGAYANNGVLDVDRITLNCRKALAALPRAEKSVPQDIVFALGGDIGTFSFTQEKGIREAKEKKISTEEIATLINARVKEGSEEMMRSFTESFLIDGFAVESPVGLHGGELVVGIARVSCGNVLAEGLSSVASDAGFSVKGFLDMRYAAAQYKKLFEEGRESAIVLCVFEYTTHAVLVRNRAVAGVGIASVGYGIMDITVEKAFSIGRQEAQGIMQACVNKELDITISERVQEAYSDAGKVLVAEIAQTVAQLDLTRLLPGNIWVVSSGGMPQINEALRAPEWLVSLPIERSAALRTISAENGFLTPLDYIIARSL